MNRVISGEVEPVRYYLALLLVVFTPPAFLFWFSVHPLIRFWRKVGPRLTLALHYAGILALAAVIFQFRKTLLAIEFGTNPVLIALAAPLFAAAILLRVHLSRQLKGRILTGLPELAPEKYKTGLLTGGIYSRVRHPRYIQAMLALLAYSMTANYLAGYILLLAAVAWLIPLVWLEEKELRQRFGAEYEAYCARVPRFLPKF